MYIFLKVSGKINVNHIAVFLFCTKKFASSFAVLYMLMENIALQQGCMNPGLRDPDGTTFLLYSKLLINNFFHVYS